MQHYSTARFFGTILVPTIIPLVAVAIWALSVADRLPGNTATHFDFSGVPNDYMSPTGAILVPLGVAAFTAVIFLLTFIPEATRRGPTARWLAGVTPGITVFLTGVTVVMVNANLNLASGEDARMPFMDIPVPLLLAIAVGGAVAFIITPAPLPEGMEGKPAGARGDYGREVTLPNGAKASWFGHARPGAMILLLASGPLLFLVVYAVLTRAWLILLFGVITSLVLIALSNFRVAISSHGVEVASVIGWPKTTVPLSEITDAEVADVHFGNWGGWGWRVSSQGTGIITRGSEALRINRSNGKLLEVTCNDPATAAGVVRALIKN